FSSRRRHTRSKRDWSSDVCSSDLEVHVHPEAGFAWERVRHVELVVLLEALPLLLREDPVDHLAQRLGPEDGELGQLFQVTVDARSEERRVGKEGGWRSGLGKWNEK